MGCQIKLWSIHGNKGVRISLGSDVPNIMKDVPNFVKDLPNFVKDVPRVPKCKPKWGSGPNHFIMGFQMK